MYDIVLLIHSWLRWAAVVAGIAATVAAFSSGAGAPGRTSADRWGLIFMITLDLQLLLGLLLYFALSPTTAAIFNDFGAAMRDSNARFWAVEHVTLMLASVVVVHVGRVLARKAVTPGSKRMRLLLCFALATITMLIAIPWPGMRAGRPLFRGV
jgi:hypothetical protein